MRSTRRSLFLVLPLVTALALATENSFAANEFNVRTFGAKGDGVTLDTKAIQDALNRGGLVRFPPGTYLCGPVTIGKGTSIVLERGCTLLASTNHQAFMKTPGDWLKATGADFVPLLTGKDLTGLTVSGEGVIDGSGSVWWEEAEKARRKVSGYTLPRPNLFVLQRCKNVRITGITIQNSPKFHFVPTECEDVLIDRVTVLAPERAANTDGIDPSNCRNVTIANCLIDCGDDNVAIKSGKKVEGREFGCENITVTNCTFKHGHGMSIGSETVGGVRNVLVRNCTFENTDNGLRIKSRREKGGLVENIVYENCQLKNVHPAISIMTYYQNTTHGKFPKDDKAVRVTATTPRFRDITIRNVTGNATTEAGSIVGLPESPVENVLLENVSLSAKEGITIANAKSVTLKNVKVIAAHGDPFTTFNAEVAGLPVGGSK
jgi:polygalacturonase